MEKAKNYSVDEVIQEPITPEEVDRVVANVLKRLKAEGIDDLTPGQEETLRKAAEKGGNI